jgi:uncharacterized integral membrane protein
MENLYFRFKINHMEDYWENLSFTGKAKFILSVVIGTMTVVLATLNWTESQVHLILWKPTVPLSLIIFGAVVGGYAISYVLAYRKFKSKDGEIDDMRTYTAKTRELELQIESLQHQLELQLEIAKQNEAALERLKTTEPNKHSES